MCPHGFCMAVFGKGQVVPSTIGRLSVMIRWLLVLVVLGFGPVAAADSSSSGMKTLQTQSYVLHTDLEQPEAEAIGSHLDTMNVAYRELFSGFRMPPRTPMDVYVFQTEEAYLRFLRDSFGGDGTGSGGMFVTRGSRKALVCWKGDGGMDWVREVLQHEGFHQFAAELFPGIPVWANEGFAELFGHAVVVDGKVVLGEVPPSSLARLRQARSLGCSGAVQRLLRDRLLRLEFTCPKRIGRPAVRAGLVSGAFLPLRPGRALAAAVHVLS